MSENLACSLRPLPFRGTFNSELSFCHDSPSMAAATPTHCHSYAHLWQKIVLFSTFSAMPYFQVPPPKSDPLPIRLSHCTFFCLYFALSTLYFALFLPFLSTQHFVLNTLLSPLVADILPHPPPRPLSSRHLRLQFAENGPFSPFSRGCQVLACPPERSIHPSLLYPHPHGSQPQQPFANFHKCVETLMTPTAKKTIVRT